MSTGAILSELALRVREFIREPRAPAESDFNQLALDLFRFQFEHNLPFRRFAERAGKTPAAARDWREISVIGTSAFKDLELTAIPERERTTVFHSSGTTEHRPSRHYHSAETLQLYEESLLCWFKPHVLPDVTHARFLLLSPRSESVPHSSLAHMFAVISRNYGGDAFFVGRTDLAGSWSLDLEALADALGAIESRLEPVVICGTAFSFVHWCDQLALENTTVHFPPGSRVFETGGYKGRSRSVPKEELHKMIELRLGIPQTHIVSEYGMSELSSQAYDRVTGSAAPRLFRFPHWSRAVIVSPETLREVDDGETGLVRVYDLANVGSVLAIQTEDLAVRRGDQFALIGRAALAESRGCSLLELSS